MTLMKKIIFSGEGVAPKTILEKFELLISKNKGLYKDQSEISEKIETTEIIYRLKFKPFIEPTFVLIEVIEYKTFNKS